MKNLMFPTQHDNQVGRVVVEFVPVDMVNLFGMFEGPTQHAFHDQTMLEVLLPLDGDQSVAVFTDGPFTIETSPTVGVPMSSRPSRMDRAHTERSSTAFTVFHRTDQARSLDGDRSGCVGVAVTSPSFVVGSTHTPRLGASVAVFDNTNVHCLRHYGRTE